MQPRTRSRARFTLVGGFVLLVALGGLIYLKGRTSGPEGCMVAQSVPASALIKTGCIISDGQGPSPRDSTALTTKATLRLAWIYDLAGASPTHLCTFVIRITPNSGGESVPDITGPDPSGSGSRTLHVTGQYVVAPGFTCNSGSTPDASSHWHLTVAE